MAETDGLEKWIPEAISQQEEHLKRICPCAPWTTHSFDTFSPRPGVFVQQCWRCGVTKTDEDYQRKTAPE